MSQSSSHPTSRTPRRYWYAPFAVIASALAQYVGASFAVHLFHVGSPAGVAWARFSFAALIFLAWRHRPLRSRRTESRRVIWQKIAFFGLVMGGMNICFYESIQRLHLGTAVTLEYLGVVILAALTGSGVRQRIAIVLAAIGVAIISWAGVDLSEERVRVGIIFALVAGGLWALYMWLGGKYASSFDSRDLLGWSMLFACMVYSPIGGPGIVPSMTDVKTIGTIVAVAVLSSAIPYGIDLWVIPRISSARYAILSSLFPATSMAVGCVMLAQWPHAGEIVGLVCVSVAVALVATAEASAELQ